MMLPYLTAAVLACTVGFQHALAFNSYLAGLRFSSSAIDEHVLSTQKISPRQTDILNSGLQKAIMAPTPMQDNSSEKMRQSRPCNVLLDSPVSGGFPYCLDLERAADLPTSPVDLLVSECGSCNEMLQGRTGLGLESMDRSLESRIKDRSNSGSIPPCAQLKPTYTGFGVLHGSPQSSLGGYASCLENTLHSSIDSTPTMVTKKIGSSMNDVENGSRVIGVTTSSTDRAVDANDDVPDLEQANQIIPRPSEHLQPSSPQANSLQPDVAFVGHTLSSVDALQPVGSLIGPNGDSQSKPADSSVMTSHHVDLSGLHPPVVSRECSSYSGFGVKPLAPILPHGGYASTLRSIGVIQVVEFPTVDTTWTDAITTKASPTTSWSYSGYGVKPKAVRSGVGSDEGYLQSLQHPRHPFPTKDSATSTTSTEDSGASTKPYQNQQPPQLDPNHAETPSGVIASTNTGSNYLSILSGEVRNTGSTGKIGSYTGFGSTTNDTITYQSPSGMADDNKNAVAPKLSIPSDSYHPTSNHIVATAPEPVLSTNKVMPPCGSSSWTPWKSNTKFSSGCAVEGWRG